LAVLTANPNGSDLAPSAKSPGQDDQGIIMEGAGGGEGHVHQRSASPCAGANGPPLNHLDDRLCLGRRRPAMG
jgi:hypothetical protein